MKFLPVIVLNTMLACAVAAAEKPVIVPGPEINIGAGKGNQYQSDLRCNPLNAKEMIVTCKHEHHEKEILLFHTADGGATWTSLLQDGGDPDSVYDPAGVAHWSFIDASRSLGYRRSKDGGATWEDKRLLDAKVDHPHIFCDRNPASPFYKSIYIAGRMFAGNIAVLRSRNGGDSFEITKIPLSGKLAKGFVFGAVTLLDGTILIPVSSASTILGDSANNYAGSLREHYCLRSADGGISFEAAIRIAEDNSLLNSGPGGAQCLSGLAVTKAGAGQRVCLAYNQEVADEPAWMMLTTSDDGGKTWIPPRAIFANTPGGWGAASPSLVANADGILGLQYYNMPSEKKFDLYFSASIDGGGTFAPPMRISTETSTEPPSQPRFPGQDQVYGDSAADGTFRAIWTDARHAAPVYTVYQRSITVQRAPMATPAKLEVASGFGGGIYEAGSTVAITAQPAPAGQEFAAWTAAPGVTITHPGKEITTVVVPIGGGKVAAGYRPQTLFTLTINNGTGGGSYPAGTLVSIKANLEKNATFVKWDGPAGAGFVNYKSAATQFRMPAADATITAAVRN